MNEDELRSELMGEGPNPDFKINYLIEAGAGAGKTYTMVHRILHQLVSGDQEPENIVAITFTEKATQEMVERLDSLLREELEQAKQKRLDTVERLEHLVREAGRMQVSTIHSFCQTMLETMPFSSPLGIEMKVEENEAAIARDFFRRRYYEDDSLFAAARNRMGIYRDDIEAYFCDRCKNREAELVFDPVGGAAYQKYENLMRVFAGEFLEALQNALKASSPGVKEMLTGELREILSMSKTALVQNQDAVDTLARLRLMNVKKIPVDDKHKDIADVFRGGDGEKVQIVWEENGRVLQDLTAKVLHSIVSQPVAQLLEEYREEKRKKHLAGFNDLLLRTRDMLRDSKEARTYFHNRYKVLYVDEMQDTDAIQAQVLFFLTTDEAHFDPQDWKKCKPVPGSLFLVGDPKQAIYRFRGADIDIYNDVLHCFEQGAGKVCKLKYNYRSVEAVCQLSKAVFEEPDLTIPAKNGKVKDPEGEREKHPEWLNGGKYQAEYTDMEAKSKADTAKGRTVSYEPLGKGTKDYEANDPGQVADFIEAMLDLKPVFGQGEKAHPARPSDFMVLTYRREETQAYVDALAEKGIPTVVSGKWIFREVEPIRRVLLHLQYLRAQQDNLALMMVLQECYELPLKQLRRFLARTGAGSLTASLQREKLKAWQRGLEKDGDVELLKVCGVLEELAELRKMTYTIPAMSLMERLFGGGYGVWQSRLSAKEYREQYAKVQQYLNCLRRAGERSFSALAAYAVECADGEFERELSLEAQEDCVHIMNLHKAKGLEAEVIILAFHVDGPKSPRNHISRENGKEKEYAGLWHGGGSFKWEVAWPEGWKEGLSAREIEKKYLKAESGRLLYVAATRPKTMLVVCGKNGTNKEGKYRNTFWQHIADKCTPADAADPVYGPAFKALIEKKPAQPPAAAKRTRGKVIKPDQMERTLEELAGKLSVSKTYAITPSKLDHGSRARVIVKDEEDAQAAAHQDPDEEAPKKTAAVPADPTRPRGPDWGTIFHRIMELSVQNKAYDRPALLAYARQAVLEVLPEGVMTELQQQSLVLTGMDDGEARVNRLAEVAAETACRVMAEGSSLRQLMEGAECYPELPFVLRELPQNSDLYSHLSGHISSPKAKDKILDVQGIIDLAVWKNGAWTVVDYKTDMIYDGESQDDYRRRLQEEYTAQIKSYAKVLERLNKGPVVRACLCAIPLDGAMVELDLS